MALLTASDLHKDVAGRPLLRGVSFKLERRERMTLAGRNGAGKTTLLRMLAGEASVDRGELSLAKGARVALHDQRPPRERDRALRDYVLSGCAEELVIEAELADLEAEMAAGAADDALLRRYARAQARLEARGGYLWRQRAGAMAHGLGFTDEDLARTLETFSGGELTRASLARVLAAGADVLLLDEPTNHLDIESLEWLERTLSELDAAIVLVAHDRWFLEAVGTSVLELEDTRARFFAGSWHRWRTERAAREIELGKAIATQRAEIARMERFIERFRYKATKARQAQSRVKRLQKMQRLEPEKKAARDLQFAFSAPPRSARVVFELQDAGIEVGAGDGGRVLLRGAEMWLERGEHVSLVGPNGAGKTTLIETLAGTRPLGAGKLSTGHNVKVGYLSQHAEELATPAAAGARVIEVAQRATGLTPGKARALLGRFLFSGEEAEKPVSGLSGGERRRLSLAVLVSSGANVLLLDEPTNHLDLESREALEDALQAFAGAVVLVSHDRALLDAVGSRTIALEDAQLHSYAGGWPEYARVREERRAQGGQRTATAAASGRSPDGAVATAGSTPGDARKSTPGDARKSAAGGGAVAAGGAAAGGSAAAASSGESAAARTRRRRRTEGPSKNRLREQRKAERGIEEAEAALRVLEDELADPAAWATKYEAAKSEARHTAARRAVEQAYTRLEALSE
jgi:ATP-binding cassette, subfamily F, member 3